MKTFAYFRRGCGNLYRLPVAFDVACVSKCWYEQMASLHAIAMGLYINEAVVTYVKSVFQWYSARHDGFDVLCGKG